jgi:hypothetical protein
MPGAPRTTPSATRGAQADLAARLQQTATGLGDRLNRRDTLIELIRSVNGTLDSSEMGDALLGQAAECLPADSLASQYRTARRSRSSSRSGDPATSMKTPLRPDRARFVASTEFSAL